MNFCFWDATTNFTHLQALLDLSSELFCLWGSDAYWQPLNCAWERVLGWTTDELRAQPWIEFVHPEDIAASLAAMEGCEAETVREFEQRCRHRDGSYRWLAWRVLFINENNACAVAQDITDRRQIEQDYPMLSPLTSECVFSTTMTSDNQEMAKNDAFYSARWQEMLGYEDEVKNHLNVCTTLVHPEDQARELRFVPIRQGSRVAVEWGNATGAFSPSSHVWGLPICDHCRAPHQWQLLETELMASLGNQLATAIHQAELYQHLALANLELQRLAWCDCLTQIANRRRFDEYLKQEWGKCAGEQMPLSLLLCDVDFFKVYNDTYGHQAGDECLKQVAAAISQVLAHPVDLVARYGGEEFAVVLPGTDLEGAIDVAEAILEAVKAVAIPHAGSAVSDCVTLSAGVATVVPAPNGSVADLIATADRALYQAKTRGRDRCFADAGEDGAL
ncbi:diguanylate cyclase [Microcoleus sp. FACHB-68]|uniref:GGDEF domain-containing protein n=1 Tax=Microcoleus sp. FACHB-68 TaxID=2692826 RepID=UPI001684A7E9|nr:diguanylate cyclase [Microcoleus sp. FACHB-68]MBD1936733.1 diguanylate cyclase [Microcoleus sp. FACHB-68]